VRTDITSNFDFAYFLDSGPGLSPDSVHTFLTQRVLGLGTTSQTFFPGFVLVNSPFEQVTSAPANGYNTTDTIRVVVGQTYYIRSGVVACASYGVPNYGKLQVLSFNDSALSVTFQVLANRNCGYKGLEPGTPNK
jgi:hypothetical protein